MARRSRTVETNVVGNIKAISFLLGTRQVCPKPSFALKSHSFGFLIRRRFSYSHQERKRSPTESLPGHAVPGISFPRSPPRINDISYHRYNRSESSPAPY